MYEQGSPERLAKLIAEAQQRKARHEAKVKAEAAHIAELEARQRLTPPGRR